MRKLTGLTTFVVVLSVALAVSAADAPKKKGWTPANDDPTVGTLGSRPKGAAPINRNAAPPAPLAAPALPKVEATAPVISGPTNTILPSAARPEAHIEGSLPGNGSGSGSGATVGGSSSSLGSQQEGMAPMAPAQPQQVNTFLATHLVVSGFIAGLIGSDLGSMIYGGTMMGDETAALVGFILRIALVIGVAVLAVRLIWGLIGGKSEDDFNPLLPRHEPSFSRSRGDVGDGRREPTFRASDSAIDDGPRLGRARR